MSENWVGVDVGGANIKIASRHGATSIPFELWKYPGELTSILKNALSEFGEPDGLAVSMTGELADCFESKQSGVAFICDCVVAAANTVEPVFYQTTGQFVEAATAKSNWLLTAASNWHATASFVGRLVSDCVVIDIGSTTTDIVPIVNKCPLPIGTTDLTRLQNQELVYSGICRTPVSAVVDTVSIGNTLTNVASEFFASMLDVYVLLNKIEASNTTDHTADRRPATIDCAARRLAKMVCADVSELDLESLTEIARQIASRQKSLIDNCVGQVAQRNPRCTKFVVLGTGVWLAREILESRSIHADDVIAMDELFNSDVDAGKLVEIGPAFALVDLAIDSRGACTR